MKIFPFRAAALCAFSGAVLLLSACDQPTSNPPPPPPPGAEKKPAGVPTKVFKQIKGIEQQHDADLERALND